MVLPHHLLWLDRSGRDVRTRGGGVMLAGLLGVWDGPL
jgi:hypothetical protein